MGDKFTWNGTQSDLLCEDNSSMINFKLQSLVRHVQVGLIYYNFSYMSWIAYQTPITYGCPKPPMQKTTPQTPVPLKTAGKKRMVTNAPSLPPWRCFGSPIVL